eukprot:3940533-Amphidinium_carterae.3
MGCLQAPADHAARPSAAEGINAAPGQRQPDITSCNREAICLTQFGHIYPCAIFQSPAPPRFSLRRSSIRSLPHFNCKEAISTPPCVGNQWLTSTLKPAFSYHWNQDNCEGCSHKACFATLEQLVQQFAILNGEENGMQERKNKTSWLCFGLGALRPRSTRQQG